MVFELASLSVLYLLVAASALAAWLHCDETVATIISIVDCAIYLILHHIFFTLQAHCFPNSTMYWARWFAPWVLNDEVLTLPPSSESPCTPMHLTNTDSMFPAR